MCFFVSGSKNQGVCKCVLKSDDRSSSFIHGTPCNKYHQGLPIFLKEHEKDGRSMFYHAKECCKFIHYFQCDMLD